MIGFNLYKSLKERMLDNKLIEVITEMKNFKINKKINLLNCKDDVMLQTFSACTNRKQKRIALTSYYKDVRMQARKAKIKALTEFYKKKK